MLNFLKYFFRKLMNWEQKGSFKVRHLFKNLIALKQLIKSKK